MVGWLAVLLLAFGSASSPVPHAAEQRVRVVDGDGAPVAGALIASIPPPTLFDPYDGWFDPIAAWFAAGRTGEPSIGKPWRRTGADGATTIEPLAAWTHVVALTPTAGGAAGFAFGQHEPITLVVKPHRFWHVRVVDSARPDRALEIPVEFGVEHDLATRESFLRLACVAPSTEGFASFGPVDLLLESSPISGGAAPSHDLVLVARLDYPDSPRRRVRCRASQLAESTAVLELPPTATLEVEVVDRAGKRIDVTREVVVTVDPRRPLCSKQWLNSDLGTWSRTTVGGVARFERIGLAAPLNLESGGFFPVVPDGEEPDPDDQRGDLSDLVQAGTTTRRMVVQYQTCRSLLVRGRCIDAAGEPLRGRQLRWFLTEPVSGDSRLIGGWRDVEGACDADGRFEQELVIDATAKGPGELVLLDLGAECGSIERGERDPAAFVTVPIDELSTARSRELGDVAFTRMPLLARVRVVDEEGAPLAGAKVSLEADRDELEANQARPWWWSSAWQTFRTGPDGRCEFRGFAPELSRSVAASAFGRRQLLFQRADSPTAELIVPLSIGASRPKDGAVGHLVGRLLLADDVPRSALRIGLRRTAAESADALPEGDDDDALELWHYDPLAPDRIVEDELPVGRWSLTVDHVLLDERTPLLERPLEFEVVEGRTTRLPTIDLRAKVRAKRVRLVDRAGAVIPGAFVLCYRRGSHGPEVDWEFVHEGETVLTTVGEWPELCFMAAGHRRVSRRFTTEAEETVVLPPPVRVAVKLPPDVELPPAPFTLDASFQMDDSTQHTIVLGADSPITRASGTFERTREIEIALPAAGRHLFSLHVSWSESGPGFSRWRGFSIEYDRPIEFAEGDAAQPLELTVTSPQIAAAVEEVRQALKN